MIERVGVVVPARDEEEHLPACLAAIRRAATQIAGLPLLVVVVLDRCRDGSRTVVDDAPGVMALEIEAGNVGIARAEGTAAVLRWAAGVPLDRLWLATTDADSVVPEEWLSGQLALAAAGWEVFVGTVDVADWSAHPAEVPPRWRASYLAVEHHLHVHGANFGCSADAYLDAGGWAPMAADEDVTMVRALAHRRIIRSAALPVITSARTDPRAAGGFGDALGALAG